MKLRAKGEDAKVGFEPCDFVRWDVFSELVCSLLPLNAYVASA